jgi:hypothetical protein
MTVAPNPNDGYFTLSIALREAADIKVIVYSVNSGQIIDTRTGQGQEEYELSYELDGLNTGMYVVILDTKEERKQKKMIIE